MEHLIQWALIVIGAVLILTEIILGAATGFDLLLIGSTLLVGGLIGFWSGSSVAAVATAGVLSAAYVFAGRKRIRDRLLHRDVPSNMDAMIGRSARVSERITPERPGRIKLEGEEWRAAVDGDSETSVEVGRTVLIRRMEGVTAYVAPDAGPGQEGRSS